LVTTSTLVNCCPGDVAMKKRPVVVADICWGQLLWHQRLYRANKPLWSLILGRTFSHLCHLCFKEKKVMLSSSFKSIKSI
jgi:hypothetical protein